MYACAVYEKGIWYSHGANQKYPSKAPTATLYFLVTRLKPETTFALALVPISSMV